jgi:serine/threonine protein kinase
VKLLDPQITPPDGQEELRVRFLREAATCARLRHPNTVTLFDYGVHDDGSLYMVMEFVDGSNLTQELRDGPFRPERAVWIAREVCRSLQEAHELGIVDRDLKSSNLMVTATSEGEAVKVVDFGIAKVLDADDVTLDSTVIGTPRYMAPELILGDPVDARVDLYSLGVVLYEMLSGRPPFLRDGTVKTLLAQVKEEPPPLARQCPQPLPPELVDVVESLRPDDRPASAGVLRQELQDVLDRFDREPAAAPAPISFGPTGPPRREWAPQLVIAVLVLSLAAPVMALAASVAWGYATWTRDVSSGPEPLPIAAPAADPVVDPLAVPVEDVGPQQAAPTPEPSFTRPKGALRLAR